MTAPSASRELSGSATATSGGVATLTLQAPQTRLGLQVSSVALSVTPSPPIPVATIYRGTVAPANVMARKTAGDRGTFTGEDDVLYSGTQLVVQWTGAGSGAVCTAVLRGYERQ